MNLPFYWFDVEMDKTIWSVDSTGKVYQFATTTWQQMPDVPLGAAFISVYNVKRIVVTNRANQVFYWNGSGWTQVNGYCTSISVTPSEIFCVNEAGQIVYTWFSPCDYSPNTPQLPDPPQCR